MSSEPFRMPRPVSRDDNDQSEPDDHPAEEPKKVERESKTMNHTRNSFDSKSKKPFLVAAAVVLVLIVAAAGWMFWSKGSTGTAIDGGRYQAVFFTNGQVYFGKLSMLNDKYLKLTEIFYLQAAQTSAEDEKKLQKASDNVPSNNVQMVKLGEEIHGPQDAMVINRDQILFYENLKDDGKVVTAINQYKAKK